MEQDRIEGGELRWQTVGQAYKITLLLVAHTVTEETDTVPVEMIRIISARKATKAERKRYEHENR